MPDEKRATEPKEEKGFTPASPVKRTLAWTGLAYALILAINRPIEMLVTSLNVVGDAVTSICVAKSEGKLDEKRYNAN